MKPIISSADNTNIPLMYLFKNATKMELLESDNQNEDIKSDLYIPKEYKKLYYKYKKDLENKATVLINNYNKFGSEEYFNIITSQLKKEGYKFTDINMIKDNKISFTTIIKTINKLNPNINIFSLIIYIIQFIALVILLLIKRVDIVKNQEYTFKEIFKNLFKKKTKKTKKLIINPSNIDINNSVTNINEYNLINKIKLKYLINYTDILYIYEKYNPEHYTYYLKVKKFSSDNKINFRTIKI